MQDFACGNNKKLVQKAVSASEPVYLQAAFAQARKHTLVKTTSEQQIAEQNHVDIK